MKICKTRFRKLCLFLTIGILIPLATSTRIHGTSKADYGVAAVKNVMVPMRDGIKLATDIYLPTDKNGTILNAKFPTILQRTPYNKNNGATTAYYYASRGYAVVFQDNRGRYQSEGVWGGFVNDDIDDGYDLCAWIGQQSWSNGKVGMIGTSYTGGTQHALAMSKAPELTTVIPIDAVSNMGYQSVRNAGAFELRFFNWIFRRASQGSPQSRDPKVKAMLDTMYKNRRDYLLNLPILRGTTPLKHTPEYEDWLVDGMRNGANGEYWKATSILDYPEQYKDIPVYLVGGWYDSWAGNTTANYAMLNRTISGPVYLIMGPWIHGRHGQSQHGQVSFGETAAIPDPLAWRLEWYDHWLKGMDNSVGNSAPFATPVRIFVMGTGDGLKTADGLLNHGGFWREEQEWPLDRTRYTNFYLHKGGQLSTKSPTSDKSSTNFTFDPNNPVPTIGGNISSGDGIMLQGALDQRGGEHIWNWTRPIPLSARRDILVFQSEPLSTDLEVTGEIEVKLWASSSALDTDFTAKLIDVYPPNEDFPGGFDLNLEDGIVRARFRDTLTEEKLMEPGKIYPFTIKLYPTSNIFKKGHRIRLDISSSNFPRFDVNPNSGEPLNQHHQMVIATNNIFHDQERPSHIVLPVIPPSSGPSSQP